MFRWQLMATTPWEGRPMPLLQAEVPARTLELRGEARQFTVKVRGVRKPG